MKKTLLQVLWDIKRNVQPDEDRGLCGLVECAFESEYKDRDFDQFYEERREWKRLLNAAGREWPEYSGRGDYPVPAPDWWSARCDYDQFVAADLIFWSDAPKWSGAYGSARIRYLNHCIRYLEAQQ